MSEWHLSPYKVLAVGRKGRKTTFDVNELIYHASTDERGLTYPFIGPTRTQSKEIVWDDHVKSILDMMDAQSVPYKLNNSELSIRFPGYGKFTVDGADNIDSLRGKSDWGGVVMDEFSSWRNKRYSWEEVIEPNLAVHEAWAVISSTTKGYEYFHRMMKLGDHAGVIEGEAFNEDKQAVRPHSDFRAYRYTSYDNPYLSRKFLESKKERLPSSVFNQEYLSRFEKYTGLIYKDFERAIHVIEPFECPTTWQFYRCMDFGATNATVCLWIAVDGAGNVFVFDEYYNSQERIQFHAGVILAKTKNPIIITYGDPSAEQAILDYAGYEVYITPATKIFSPNKDWVLSGIEKVQELLKVSTLNKKPKLYVMRNCANLIREFESYHWLENKSGEMVKEMPAKEDDHCLDALRYFAVSYTPVQGGYTDDIYNDMNIPTNKFTGY